MVEEAIADHIGILGLVELRNIFPMEDEPNGRITHLAKGWVLISASAERGPSGRANIGGIGALISPQTYEAYLSHKLLSPRILALVFRRSAGKNSKGTNRIHILVTYCYTATEGYKELSRAHYEIIANYIASVPLGDIVIIVGDFNATVVTDPPLTKSQKALGVHRRVLYSPKGEPQNNNSEIFREFIDQNDLYPINTRFRQSHNNNYHTFSGPNGRRARLDYILVRGKWASGFRTVTVRPLRNQWSDHKMIIARGKWRLCRQQRLKGVPRLDLSVMKDPDTAGAFLSAFQQRYQFNSEDSLDQSFIKFSDAYKETCHGAVVNIPLMTKRQRRVPWEDHAVTELRKARHVAVRQYRCNRSAESQSQLRQISLDLTACYKQRLEDHALAMCGRIGDNFANNRTDSDLAYRLLDELCGSRSPRVRIRGDTAEDRLLAFFNHFSTAVFGGQTGVGGEEDRWILSCPSPLTPNLCST